MAGIRRVTGLGFDGSNVTATFGRKEIRLISASYADRLEKGKLSQMGSQEIDEISNGTYATEDAKLKISAVTFRTVLMPAMPATGGGNVRMPIVIGREHPDLGDDSDLLEGCTINNWAAAVENSNKVEEVELTATVRQIRWTHQRKTINQLAGAVPAGATGF